MFVARSKVIDARPTLRKMLLEMALTNFSGSLCIVMRLKEYGRERIKGRIIII